MDTAHLWQDNPLSERWHFDCQHHLGLSLTPHQVGQLDTYFQHLVGTNAHTNLIRYKDTEDFLYRHLMDSLTLLPIIDGLAPETLADIGSGAGLPAIPIAIVRPQQAITAIESIQKKAAFIQSAKTVCHLDNLQVLARRAEDLARMPTHRERYDAITARAVANLRMLLELTVPLVKPGGYVIAMKGQQYASELAVSQQALNTLKLELIEVKSYPQLCESGAVILVFEKQQPTPATYPRSMTLMKKTPL